MGILDQAEALLTRAERLGSDGGNGSGQREASRKRRILSGSKFDGSICARCAHGLAFVSMPGTGFDSTGRTVQSAGKVGMACGRADVSHGLATTKLRVGDLADCSAYSPEGQGGPNPPPFPGKRLRGPQSASERR